MAVVLPRVARAVVTQVATNSSPASRNVRFTAAASGAPAAPSSLMKSREGE